MIMKRTTRPSRTHLRALRIVLALTIVLVSAVIAARSAQAQTFSVLYAFAGEADGGYPYAGLIRDAKGNLYGTTYYDGASGLGTVFKLDNTGKERVLYSFTGIGGDGANPFGGLVRDTKGNLYGTTLGGGSGYGTVFTLDRTGKETVLYRFPGTGTDGASPLAGVVRDRNGNLYGTTYYGGAGYGTAFKLDTTGKETVLWSFTGDPDGAYPWAGLVPDAQGNLYGITSAGGAFNCSCGMVFKLDNTVKETVLYGFIGGGYGALPVYGYLIRDAKGNLYGTTSEGGATFHGTVFALDKTGNETVLYSFTGIGGDGAYSYAGVVRDTKGNLYGTTLGGGASGWGTVFKLDKTGKETVLHSFAYSTDGALPYAGLVRDSAGNLYGTTNVGGASGAGTVFKLTP